MSTAPVRLQPIDWRPGAWLSVAAYIGDVCIGEIVGGGPWFVRTTLDLGHGLVHVGDASPVATEPEARAILEARVVGFLSRIVDTTGAAETYPERCFACDRPLGKAPALVTCADAQDVYVGRECVKRIAAAGAAGYQPPKGGPRLYMLEHDPKGAR